MIINCRAEIKMGLHNLIGILATIYVSLDILLITGILPWSLGDWDYVRLKVLPSIWSVYAITASNGHEISYAAYCPEQHPSPPSEFLAGMGDVFSISWMEDRLIINFIITFKVN